MRRSTIAAAFLLALAPLPAAATEAAPPPARVQQLRIYEVPPANEAVFHARFRDHAMRIMARYGFAIRSIWRSENEGKVEFVYLLDWPDTQTMKTAWDAFLADPEWIQIKKDTGARHGRFVDAIAIRTLEPVAYSPDRAAPRTD
jgi:hypothetical protein